jgi:hypothetical protein
MEWRKRSERLLRQAIAVTNFDLDNLSRESAEARIAVKNSKTTKKKSDQGVQ